MATWNTQKSIKQARADALAGTTPPTPPDFTDIGTPPIIDVGGVESVPNFFIPGVVPERADLFVAAEPEEPIERWPARPRGLTFPLNYQGLDAGGLDAEFVTANGLTASVSQENTWVGYYPGLSSGTQIGELGVQQFAVGLPLSFTIAGGVSLYGTAYLPPATTVYAVDSSAAGTQWNGTVSGVNYSTNTLTVVPDYISRTILISDPTQVWSLYHTSTEASEGEAIPE